jgi:hypothetical protein
MPASGSWDVICGADSGQIVLGVGFPAAGCREAGFSDLAARIGPEYRLLQARALIIRPGQRLSADAYVGPLIEDIRRDRGLVLAVLGYCVGSVYAAVVAEEISRWQPPPKAIMFDPQSVNNKFLCLQFRNEIDSLSALLSDDEIERASKVATEISQSATGDIADIATEIIESYLEVITPAFERAGLGDARSDKFAVAFASYISWLSVTDQIDPSLAWKRSTVIASSAYADLPDRAYLADGDHGITGQVIPFDVGHAELLRSDSVARAVLGLLGSR